MRKNLISIVAGGVACMILGTVWYMALGNPWMAAAGITMAEVDAGAGASPYIASFVAWLVSAFAIGMLFDKLGDTSWGGVIKTAGLVWLSVGITSTVLSTMYGMRGTDLLWIDGLYTLICLIAILAVRKVVFEKLA